MHIQTFLININEYEIKNGTHTQCYDILYTKGRGKEKENIANELSLKMNYFSVHACEITFCAHTHTAEICNTYLKSFPVRNLHVLMCARISNTELQNQIK